MRAVTISILAALIYIPIGAWAAGDAGSRASFTRGGFCGAKYIAFGGSAEAAVDDVYSLYWNPAGLAALKAADIKPSDEIRARAEKGDLSGISPKDLEHYGEAGQTGIFQLGMSGTTVSIDRNAAFSGFAFTTSAGAFGAGVYSLYSPKIEEYDTSAQKTGSSSYSGSEAIISYAQNIGVSSIGFSLKGLYETISDATFSGAACDIGVQANPIPFLKIGLVAQDLGGGMYPVSGKNLEKKYELGSPTLRSSAMVESRTAGVSFALGIVRHIEQKEFIYTAGLRYSPSSRVALSLGYFDKNFSVGAGAKFWKCEFWYAFSYDRIGMGYNNSVSLTAAL